MAGAHLTAPLGVPSIKLLNQDQRSLVLRAKSLRDCLIKFSVLAEGMVVRVEWDQGIDIYPLINLQGEKLKLSISVSASAKWRSSALKTITVMIRRKTTAILCKPQLRTIPFPAGGKNTRLSP